jgi:hypothetical protein
MLTNRPWGDVVGDGAASSRLRERNTAADRAQIRGYAQQYLSQIVHVLECVQLSPLSPSSAYFANSVSLRCVPPPMLLLFKTNDCLRHAERKLHSGADSFLITLKHCLRVLLASGGAATENAGAATAAVQSRSHQSSFTLAGKTIDRLRAIFHRLRLHVACVHLSPNAPLLFSTDILSQLLAADLPDAAGARGRLCRLGRPQLDWGQHIALEVTVARAAVVALMMIYSHQLSDDSGFPARAKKLHFAALTRTRLRMRGKKLAATH